VLKFTTKAVFDNQKDISKIVALVPILHVGKISILGSISKFLKLIVFGQILVVLGKFCCIGSG
jgi:hypothetical protein